VSARNGQRKCSWLGATSGWAPISTLVVVAEPGSAQNGGWEHVLRCTAHTFRRVALTHPHLVPLLVTRTLSSPLARRPLGTLRPPEELLELFITAGFDHRGRARRPTQPASHLTLAVT
jgi:hypothetical protein